MVYKYLGSILKIAVIIALLTASFSVIAQEKTKVDLKNANTLEFDKKYNKDIQRLIGNVIFKLDSTYLYCDSAYHYIDVKRIDAFSNVHIRQGDTLDIYGDTLIFNGETNIAEIHGHVEMIDDEMILTTDHLKYDLNTEKAYYYTGGKIVDTRNQLTSLIGEYFADVKEFYFKKDVVFTNPSYIMYSDTLKYDTKTEIAYFYGPTTIEGDENYIYCENGWNDSKSGISQFKKNAYLLNLEDGSKLKGDSLYYDRNLGMGKAFDNVVVTDTLQKMIIEGAYGQYNEISNISFVTGNAMLTQYDEYDSLFLHADTLLAISDSIDTNRVVFAYHKVRFYKTDLQGMCDSLVYTFSDSVIRMYYAPVLWSDINQLYADSIWIKTGGGQIESIHLTNVAFIISQDDTAKFNQIKGDYITGIFQDNELVKVLVKNRSQTVYYLRDDDEALIGVNTTLSDDVVIFIEDNEISGITYIKNPDAIIYPIAELPKEKQYLKDFKWLDSYRPKQKEDIFNWKPVVIPTNQN